MSGEPRGGEGKPRRPRKERSGRRSRANPGRVAALRVLASVDTGAHAEDLLDELAPTEDKDRRLAWSLVFGVLRRRGAIDALLSPHLSRSMDKLDAPVRAALRVGVWELSASRVPRHAAVSQAVEACRAVGAGRASGFVNAVLRKVGEPTLSTDPMLDLPPWLQERWSDWEAWVALLASPAPTCGVSRDPSRLPEGLPAHPTSLDDLDLPGAFVLDSPGGRLDQLPGFAEGAWWVMDPAAAAVADLCLAWSGKESPEVLDACAAPGGKSMRLASLGAKVRCVDSSANRLRRLQANAERVGLDLPCRVHSWEQGSGEDLGEYDVVLVDAPCTGLGTVRRHPEIKWRRLRTDPAAMALRQRRILANAAKRVRPGGLLVYAVCSTEPEEGRAVAESLAGWRVAHSWTRTPPTGDEDGFQCFGLIRDDPT